MEHIGFRSLYITGLNHFTLSHCGSRTPLPTLKPGLTASAPRLSTSCLPSFTGLGISLNYTTRTEPAHLQMYYNTLFVGMDVHKETFSLCCYDLQQDRIFHAQKMEADYKKVLNYLNAVRKAIGDDVQFHLLNGLHLQNHSAVLP